jgi:alpha-beta hydrolase superfamily lysophospholipase
MERFFFFLLKLVFNLLVAIAVVIVTLRIIQERRGPELKPWHTAILANEFHAGRTDIPDFKAYLALENKLFQEMNATVETRLAPEDRVMLNRYYPKAITYPGNQSHNWNRSFFFLAPHPKGSVVLLHGVTDSPYTMHALADIFIKKGYCVFVPRMPGHGTIPGALRQAAWPDWVAAVRLACQAARDSAPGKPFILCGYSNGGLLAVKFTLDELEKGKAGRPPQKLILLAPALGITRIAVFSNWYRALAIMPYFKKVEWLTIIPEYDPFKYNSFPKMASDQTYRLIHVVNRQLKALKSRDGFGAFPPVLTFTSVVDSTVITPELVSRFYSKLKANGSELVLYDVNRSNVFDEFVRNKHDAFFNSLATAPMLPYSLTIIMNQKINKDQVFAHRRVAQATAWVDEPLDVKWPQGVYSLSHLAIPNSPADPLYGNRLEFHSKDQFVLGLLQPRGETDVLDVPASQFLRLRFNPFFGPMKKKIESFI